jgi:hypothetical protein
MNHIQKLSQELVSQRLKLQMGLDPQLDIEPRMLRAMWVELQQERRLAKSKIAIEDRYPEIDRAA